MRNSILVQQPRAAAGQLFLLLHEVGADPSRLVPLGSRLAAVFPDAFVVSIEAGETADGGTGRQWFSERGVTDANRLARVAGAMPGLLAAIEEWQRLAQVEPEATVLIGHGQGALMALESSRELHFPARTIVSIGGQFAAKPHLPNPALSFHLLHGQMDTVVPPSHAITASRELAALGAYVTADVIAGVGHEINPEVEDYLMHRLKSDGHRLHRAVPVMPERPWVV